MSAPHDGSPALALLTAARRYLIGRRNAAGDDHDARRLLADVLVEVERSDPDRLPPLEELGGRFLSVSLAPGGSPARRAAAEREFGGFRAFVGGLDPAALTRVQPMPARRVLSTSEVAQVNARLLAELGFGRGYYYPLGPTPRRPSPLDAYLARWFERAVDGNTLRGLLRERGVGRIWALSEFAAQPDYEMDTELLDPGYSGEEVFYTSASADWLLYESHERSVTVGGWLAQRVRELCPDAEANRWSLEGAFPDG